jgi:hypothetical protein
MAGKKTKLVLSIIVIASIIVGSIYYAVFVYPKSHHRDVQQESAILIKTIDLTNAFSENEAKANSIYLNKVLIIEDEVISVDTDQSGNVHVILGNSTSFSNISVTFSNHPTIKVGQKIKVKGLCTGYLSDVILTEAKKL